MQITIPNPFVVHFVVTPPIDKHIGPFYLTTIPTVGEQVRISSDDFVYGGEVTKVIWHLRLEAKDNAMIEVYFKDVANKQRI